MSSETHEFQAEVTQLLDLMIHSLYSHKEVFLRELVSNASDALDKLRFEGLTDEALLPAEPLAIRLEADSAARTLMVSDNGIGMTREELVTNLGTIARSGTGEFLARLRELGSPAELPPDLIGQFGVGFYASFMVADEVTVVSRRAGEDKATRWHSSGAGSYEVEDAARDSCGTSVTLKLKEVDPDAGISDFSDEWVLRNTVKKYSDFVAYPIRLALVDSEGADPREVEEPLNSMKAIWLRPDDEVGEDEHKEFYKHVSHDWNDPLLHVSTRIEGTFEARALLYIPSVAPFDLYHREMAHRGIQLYVKRVFIMDECRELMPDHLRFVKGVVDAEDLPLNVSREMLQQDRQIQVIRRHLVKKILDALVELARDDSEKYLAFWHAFGAVLKEGLLELGGKHDRILDLVRCHTSEAEGLTSLEEVVERMPEDQEVFYYLVGGSLDALRRSPQLEAFRAKGVEVLLFTDPVDEVWLAQAPPEYLGKSWKNVGQGAVDLEERGSEDGEAEDRGGEEGAFEGLLACLRAAIQDHVKEVRLSSRLTESPACLVMDEGDLSPQLAQMLRQAGQEVPVVKPILELNPSHPLLVRLRERYEANGTDPRLRDYATLLLGHAQLAEGGLPDDPVAFTERLSELMLEAL